MKRVDLVERASRIALGEILISFPHDMPVTEIARNISSLIKSGDAVVCDLYCNSNEETISEMIQGMVGSICDVFDDLVEPETVKVEISEQEKELRAIWTEKGVSEERQQEMLVDIEFKANPGYMSLFFAADPHTITMCDLKPLEGLLPTSLSGGEIMAQFTSRPYIPITEALYDELSGGHNRNHFYEYRNVRCTFGVAVDVGFCLMPWKE